MKDARTTAVSQAVFRAALTRFPHAKRLAEVSGVHYSKLREIKHGRAAASLHTLLRLAHAASVPLSTLLREAEHELDQPAFVPRVEHVSLADYREAPERFERMATGVVRVVVQSPDGSAYASIGGGEL